jgi:hypothetical protein
LENQVFERLLTVERVAGALAAPDAVGKVVFVEVLVSVDLEWDGTGRVGREGKKVKRARWKACGQG